MNETDLANAAWWAAFWGKIENWAFLGVVVALAIEFAALKFGAPYKAKIDTAREERISAAGAVAETAKATAAAANERTAVLENETARLTANNLELATNLENERAARAHIEVGLADRHVSQQQRTTLAVALKGVKLDVMLSRYSDPESSAYAREVASALSDAGQTVEEGSVIIASSGNLRGLFVEETADPRLINALIVARLVTQKLQSTKDAMFRTGEGLNVVVIGLKPNPF